MGRATQDVTLWSESSDYSAVVNSDGDLHVTTSKNPVYNLWQAFGEDNKCFVTTTDIINVSGTAETDFFLIRNPNGSGVKCRIKQWLLSNRGTLTADSQRFRIYRSPTITSNGTTITARPLSGTGTAATLFSHTPTISNRGTLIESGAVFYGGLVVEEDLNFIIPANSSVLVTVQNNGTNKDHSVTVWFAEDDA